MIWSKPEASAKRRAIIAASAVEKQGKDHWALTASLDERTAPVYLFNYDYGLEGVVEKFQARGGEIYHHVFRMPANWNEMADNDKKQYAGALYDEFQAYWRDALGKGQGTIVVDTHTEEWEIRRLAKFGKLSQIMPHHYTEVNGEFRADVRESYESGMSVIFLQKRKPIYIGNNRSGQDEPAGFSDMPFLVQANVQPFRNQADGRFYVFVKDCRQNSSLAGQYIDVHDDWLAYPHFLDRVFETGAEPVVIPPTVTEALPDPYAGLAPEVAALLRAQNSQ